MLRILQWSVLLLWMGFLEWKLWAASQLDSNRLALLKEIPSPNLGELLPTPEIVLLPQYIAFDSALSELRADADYLEIKKFYDLWFEGNFEKAYVASSRFLEKKPNSVFAEWLHFFKADALFQAQKKLAAPKFSLVLEDYELAMRRYPLSREVPRALYQTALIQTEGNLYAEANQNLQRAMREYPNDPLQPLMILLNGEQFFMAGQKDKALAEYSAVVRRHPRSQAAVDAAFRRAFLLFSLGDYVEALKTYRDLERFHSEVAEQLKMQTEASSMNKYVDRIYFAETLYLTGNIDEALGLFQNLGNLFPREKYAAQIWIRYGDCFLAKGQLDSAKDLYGLALKRYVDQVDAQIVSRLRLADLNILTSPVEAHRENEKLYEDAYRKATEAKLDRLASLVLAKQAQYYLWTRAFPKAQSYVEEHQRRFQKMPESEWVKNRATQLLELEILDHYRAGDFLAALTRYLVFEKDQNRPFKDIDVLLKLADAAREMGLFDKASDILNRVIYLESSPVKRQEALLKLIDILVRQGDLKKASERLRRFNFAYPTTPYAYIYERAWGDLYRKLGNVKQSADRYERALAAANTESKIIEIRDVYLELGQHYESNNLPMKAVDSYERYLGLFAKTNRIILGSLPMTAKDLYQTKVARYRIADLYFNMSDYVRALQAYQRVSRDISEEPFVSHARYRIGECYLKLNDRPAALEAFGQLKSDDPKNVWVRAAKAYIASVQMEVKYGIRIFN